MFKHLSLKPIWFESSTRRSPEDTFRSQEIIGWTVEDDYPNEEELQEMGHNEETTELDDGGSLPGDKLLGWPQWVQGVEYPLCPECNHSMHM